MYKLSPTSPPGVRVTQQISAVHLLFCSGMVGLLAVLFMPVFMSLLVMPGLCCILRVP